MTTQVHVIRSAGDNPIHHWELFRTILKASVADSLNTYRPDHPLTTAEIVVTLSEAEAQDVPSCDLDIVIFDGSALTESAVQRCAGAILDGLTFFLANDAPAIRVRLAPAGTYGEALTLGATMVDQRRNDSVGPSQLHDDRPKAPEHVWSNNPADARIPPPPRG